jgi:hypothetical protein
MPVDTHAAEEWVELRRAGAWRFIVVGGLRAAVATAFAMTALGMGVSAYFFYRDGQTLDLHWFQVPGRDGAPVFLLYRHVVTLLPVGFLFALVFWLFAGTKCWLLNEKAHREAPIPTPPAPEDGPTRSARRRLCSRAGSIVNVTCVGVFLCFLLYLPWANQQPALRLPPPAEEALYAAGLAGAALVWIGMFLEWLGDLFGRCAQVARRWFAPGDQGYVVTQTASAFPALPAPEPTPRIFRLHQLGVNIGAGLLVCDLVFIFFRVPVGELINRLLACSGLALILLGVASAAYGAYAEGLKVAGPRPATVGGRNEARTMPAASIAPRPTTWPWVLVVAAVGLLLAGGMILLGWW